MAFGEGEINQLLVHASAAAAAASCGVHEAVTGRVAVCKY